MSILVYSKEDCPFCDKAKSLLTIKGYTYNVIEIGKDMLREDFVSLFPDQKTVPLIIMNGVKIGGFDDLKRHFDRGSI